MKKINIVFSTDGYESDFVSKLFTDQTWNYESKIPAYHKDGVVICHEEGFNIARNIVQLKKHEFGKLESLDIQKSFIKAILDEVQKEIPLVHTLLISHPSIGRYMCHCLEELDIDYRILYVRQNEQDVIQFYNKKLDGGKQIGRLWKTHFNNPFEPAAINKLNDAQWNHLTFMNKIGWFCDETDKQWEFLKTLLNPDKMMSIQYEHMSEIESLEKMSSFFELPYYQIEK